MIILNSLGFQKIVDFYFDFRNGCFNYYFDFLIVYSKFFLFYLIIVLQLEIFLCEFVTNLICYVIHQFFSFFS